MTARLPFSDTQRALVESLKLAIRGDAWAADEAKGIRAYIKTSCIDAQELKCCYCNRFLATQNHRMWDVDHVVPRSTHPQFTFEPNNLVASCPDCNIAKGDAQTLANKRRVTYPDSGAGFTIVHPNFDVYGDHIFHSGLIYIPKTPKGKNTIYTCDLLRYAQAFIEWPTSISDDSYESEVDAIMAGGAGSSAALEDLISLLPIAPRGTHSEQTS